MSTSRLSLSLVAALGLTTLSLIPVRVTAKPNVAKKPATTKASQKITISIVPSVAATTPIAVKPTKAIPVTKTAEAITFKTVEVRAVPAKEGKTLRALAKPTADTITIKVEPVTQIQGTKDRKMINIRLTTKNATLNGGTTPAHTIIFEPTKAAISPK